MSFDLSTFNFAGKQVRTTLDDCGLPWVNGADVCVVLGYSNVAQALEDNVPAKYRRLMETKDNLGRTQTVAMLSEPGLFSFFAKSRKKAAEPFQDWLYEEVLPTIRKTRKYNHDDYLARVRLEQENAQLKETASVLYEQVEAINNISAITVYGYGRELSDREVSVMAEYISTSEKLKETTVELRRARNRVLLQKLALDDYAALVKKYLKNGDSDELRLSFKAAAEKHKLVNESINGYIFLDEDGIVRFDYDAMEALRKSLEPVKPAKPRDPEHLFALMQLMQERRAAHKAALAS